MAKKKTTKKKSTTKKNVAKKVTKKKVTKKSPAKKSTKKKVTKKKTKKKTSSKKSSKKVTKKSPARKTKKKVTKKKSTTKTATRKTTGDNGKKKTKTKKAKVKKLPAKERRYYLGLLLVKRAELFGDITAMEKEALMSDNSNLSHLPVHMADIGSDNYDQDLRIGLMESERKLLKEIDEAITRIEEGSYGICAETGVPIGKARLEAKPWAKYCIEVAREKERGGRRF